MSADPPRSRAFQLIRGVAAAPARAMSDDTATLVERARAGDPSAQTAIWDRYASMVYGMARRALQPGADVDDVTQEAFSAVFRDLRKLRDPLALRSFIGAIAANQIRRELGRRRLRRWFERLARPHEDEAARGPSPSAAFALRRLHGVLDLFRPTDRLVFVLRHVEEHSVEEVAALLRISKATVKRKDAHVQAVLAKRLRNDPFLVDYLPPLGREGRDE